MEQGNLYILPADEDPRGDPKDRAHLAVSLVDLTSDLITLAYCSTQRIEADLGAPHVLIDPAGPTFAVTGLRETTYVYPSRLVTEEVLRLGRPIGRLLDEMPAVRRELRSALGIGLGTAHSPGAALGSFRGQLIQLGPLLTEQLATRYAVVVANPNYARKQRFMGRWTRASRKSPRLRQRHLQLLWPRSESPRCRARQSHRRRNDEVDR